MEFQEFKFIYDDCKLQIKQLPDLKALLNLTEKSTKKLDCLTLYTSIERRDLDLQIEEQEINREISDLYKEILRVKDDKNGQKIFAVEEKIKVIKAKNIDLFDLLAKQDQILSQEVQLAEYFIGQEQPNEIKQVDEDQEPRQQNIKPSNIEKLKKEIEGIQLKIVKINAGKGKWLISDHNDFVKIYNKCGGVGKKIIQEAVKILGMNNTEILDHLQVYEQYLQLQKQKKIITYEYKQIKQIQEIQKIEENEEKKIWQNEKLKQKKLQDVEQNIKKKQQIKIYKEKKQQEKRKIIQQAEKKEEKRKPSVGLSKEKQKQIQDRNKNFIKKVQQNFKKSFPNIPKK